MSELGQQRHRARERAFEILYEAEMKDRDIDSILTSLPITPDDYTVTLVRSVKDHKAWAESQLSSHSLEWSLERMSIVDRIIMTLALCELRLDDGPSRAVIFDEAVELAKVYSSDAAPSFVNGVLSACAESGGLR